MSERTSGTSSERGSDEDAAGAAGAQNGTPEPAVTRQPETGDRTVVMANPPHAGTATAGHSDPEQTQTVHLRDLPGAVPPWQRAGASETDASNQGGIDVGRPQHGTSPDGDPSSSQGPDGGQAYGFAGAPDAAGSFAPPGRPAAHDAPRAGTEGEQEAGRTEQPVFEQSDAAASRPAASTSAPSNRPPRRASLQLKRLDPWSVLKLSLVLSVAGFLAWMVAVGILYGVLEGMGVWDQLNGTYSDLTSLSGPQSGDALISAGRVFGVAAVVGAINVVLFTAMATVGSFLYNVASDLAGGIELTLSERD